MDNNVLIDAHKKYQHLQRKQSYYPHFCKLIDHHFEIEAFLLISATWNTGCFRVANFDLNLFKEKIKQLDIVFNNFKDKDFKTIKFDDYSNEIKDIFETLSCIEGVKYTGASKIMHLKNRQVFVMWDGYIRGEKYPKKCYRKLEIFKKGEWQLENYAANWEGYLKFLKNMQDKFGNLDSPDMNITLAKAVDEYNFINITQPLKDMGVK